MRNKSILEKPVGGSSGDIADAIAKKHNRQHAITSTSDHTSTATSGKVLKADANGLPIDASNTDSQVAAAVSASHTAATVTDSDSVDFTLSTQDITATVKQPWVLTRSLFR